MHNNPDVFYRKTQNLAPAQNSLPFRFVSQSVKTTNMQYIKMLKSPDFTIKITSLCSLIFCSAMEVSAQMPQVRVPPSQQPAEDSTWWYITLFALFLGLAGAVMWMMKSRKAEKEASDESTKKAVQEANNWDANSVDADKEMEWFRRHKKTVNKAPIKNKNKKKEFAEKLLQNSKILNRPSTAVEDNELKFSEKEFKEKLQTIQFNQLPIFKFSKLELARPFAPLMISSDDALMSAVEQTQDEFEEDEEIRDLAVRILAAFKTRNSVEALSQVALYDLSSNLRSKAVSILADFDHESVFEGILLACADPTREVKAAAARGLFRLSFDRADAWTRIAETNDEFRMRQATRAAMEADLVTRSFDRLTHQDQKIAYEAVTLLALMIRAGETEPIFKALVNHKDTNVKLALLHVFELTKEEGSLPHLCELLEKTNLPEEIKVKINKVIESFELIPA